MKKQGFRFPLGIWIVLATVIIPGLLGVVGGQALSFFAWDVALSLGLQEDHPESTDVVELTMGAVSWGEAITDTLVQGTLVIVTLIGILRQRQYGYVAGMALYALWVYVTMMATFQRVGLYQWGLVSDFSRLKSVGIPMAIFWGIPGIISIICLKANRSFFSD